MNINRVAGGKIRSNRSRSSKRTALLAASLAMLLPVGSASAVVFHDFIHTLQNVFTQLWTESKDAAQYSWEKSEQARHLAQMVKDYEAKLSSMVNFVDGSMKMGAGFEERTAGDIARLTRERCPGAAGAPSLSSLWKPFVPDMAGDIAEQQLEICMRIVMAESERYNEQVRMLKRIMEESGKLERLARAREAMGKGATPGELTSNSNDIERFTARGSMDMQYTQTVLTAYDGYIASLQKDQQYLAQLAMHGDRKPWGSVIQGAVLKSALEIQK